jgi:hypothetical protein
MKRPIYLIKRRGKGCEGCDCFDKIKVDNDLQKEI